MHYVLGDIRNELRKLKSILDQIHLGVEDELIVLIMTNDDAIITMVDSNLCRKLR